MKIFMVELKDFIEMLDGLSTWATVYIITLGILILVVALILAKLLAMNFNNEESLEDIRAGFLNNGTLLIQSPPCQNNDDNIIGDVRYLFNDMKSEYGFNNKDIDILASKYLDLCEKKYGYNSCMMVMGLDRDVKSVLDHYLTTRSKKITVS